MSKNLWLRSLQYAWIVIALASCVILFYALAKNGIDWWRFDSSPCKPGPGNSSEIYNNCLAYHQVRQQLGLPERFWAIYFTTGALMEILPWLLIGLLIFWRKPNLIFHLLFSLLLVLWGALGADSVVVSIFKRDFPAYSILATILVTLYNVLMVLVYRFPSGNFVPRRMRWVAGLWILIQLLGLLFPHSVLDIFSWPGPLPRLLSTAFALSLVGSLAYRYRTDSSPVERQQIKWVIAFGAIFILVWVVNLFIPVQSGLSGVIYVLTYTPLYYLSSALFAISFGISVLRYRLWDIDVLIRRTLIYGALTATLALIYFSAIILLQHLFRVMTGQGESPWIIALSTLAIAGLFTPLRTRIQSDIDRRFYRRKYDAEKMLRDFSTNVREEFELEQLKGDLITAVNESMQPEHISLWLRKAKDTGEINALR